MIALIMGIETEQDRRTDEWLKEMEEQWIDPYAP